MSGTAPSSAVAGASSNGTEGTPTRRAPPWASAGAGGPNTTRSDATAQSHMRMELLYTNPTTCAATPKIGGFATSHVSPQPRNAPLRAASALWNRLHDVEGVASNLRFRSLSTVSRDARTL